MLHKISMYKKTKKMTIKEKFIFVFKIYGLNSLSMIVLATISFLVFGKQTNRIPISFDKQMISVFAALIMAPILEELIYRLVLNDFSKIKNIVFASLAFLVAMLFSNYKNDGLDSRYLVIFTWIIIIWICYFINKKVPISKFKKYETILIFISSFLFSISHFENYNMSNGNYSFIINFLMLFISGLLVTKVRLKIGVVWGMFTHFLINLVPSIILLFEHFNK